MEQTPAATESGKDTALRLNQIRTELAEAFLFHPCLPLSDMLSLNERVLAMHKGGRMGIEHKAEMEGIAHDATEAINAAAKKYNR